MKRTLALIALAVLVLTGCWDRRELNDIGIVVAVALDKEPKTGKIIVTSQIIRPAALAKGASQKEAPVEIFSATGNTTIEAARNVTQVLDRRNVYFHTKLLVVSEQIAKEGILSYLDVFSRGRESRGYIWICIAKNASSREVLGVKKGIEQIQARHLVSLIRNEKFHYSSHTLNILRFYKQILGTGMNPVTGALEIVESPAYAIEQKPEKTTRNIKLHQSAVFKKDKLVGYLTPQEAQGYNWVIGKPKNGIISMPSFLDPGKKYSVEILNSSSDIIPSLEGGKASFVIRVQTTTALAETQGQVKPLNPEQMLDLIKKAERRSEETIKTEIETAIRAAQKKFNSDIFGFGNTISKKYPKEWDKMKTRWEEMFPEAEYTIEVKATIKRTELTHSPMKAEE
ncbi:Ger(x)C family spore germination protein [Paenibacillus ehimensis]|uniref:Ger(X)C family spore germination protein n=1 Tax=Paenibacillus ehimensis TaxID=79264 RepID=A0ABT8V863_9BACL|nr:Ger(x)C family spore germination protein [Paenibacillus ehimensis]MDO3675906.1 Ger(x)C family spore germination protein [Paenibacillus ehimensis]MEC0208535.1 Ger(x)C family spore germination protein [Paenibacillus ehimensis]